MLTGPDRQTGPDRTRPDRKRYIFNGRKFRTPITCSHLRVQVAYALCYVRRGAARQPAHFFSYTLAIQYKRDLPTFRSPSRRRRRTGTFFVTTKYYPRAKTVDSWLFALPCL